MGAENKHQFNLVGQLKECKWCLQEDATITLTLYLQVWQP